MRHTHTIIKRKESVGCHHCAICGKACLAYLLKTLAKRIYAAGLAAALADKLPVFYDCNSIALEVLAYDIGKLQVGSFL